MATQRKTNSKLSSQAVMEEVKNLAMLGGGVVLGSVGGRLIDKVLKVDGTETGFNAKAMARPVVLIAAGAAGAVMLKEKNMKLLATGVGAAGVLSGVKVILKKDLLAGLAEFSGLGNDDTETTSPTKVFREPVQLAVERYNPDLPALNAVYMPYPNPMDVQEQIDMPERNMGAAETDNESEPAFIEII
jgi:hypothetical protein